MKNIKTSIFVEAKEALPMKIFTFSTEVVIFNRGYRLSRSNDDGDVQIYNTTSSNYYSNISNGEMDVITEHGFKRGTAILQLFKCKNDIERVTFDKKHALETNNSSQATYYDRKRVRLLKKCKSIELYLNL